MAQNDSQSPLPRGDIKLAATDVEACRICLETNNKLHSLQGTHLRTCMEAIGGFTNPFGCLPNYVCYECAPILIKCYKLIKKSKTAQTTLLDIFEKNGQITKALIKDQNRSQPNLKSSLDSHLLVNYYHIKYDNGNNTPDLIKTEAKPNVNIEIKIDNKENLKIEELDDSLEEVKEDIPLIEVSDDEASEDFISLAPYKEVEEGKREGPQGISHQFQPKPITSRQIKKAEKRKLRQYIDSFEKPEYFQVLKIEGQLHMLTDTE